MGFSLAGTFSDHSSQYAAPFAFPLKKAPLDSIQALSSSSSSPSRPKNELIILRTLVDTFFSILSHKKAIPTFRMEL